ncbi:MAG: HPr family phosphocarrier protein [Leptospiraceae bacterium]|nr:HPr family phosphocarrier protein [Leptospiraceae bacterium]MBK7056262.1 HPr family phosphocarrier protein [Leptospiraceae bacterium]MBK9501516.1 HPr family phosphocarrier protein [Leptospiraceae bacterium]MBL0266049.1 HPr family phosphocarrier protein [Leptospiraceae bacterium]MBP9161934.1 HPr family phosphocarrier protein [Leptospiraceae bacterium]
MKKVTLKIKKDGHGMHARPASLFVKLASQFPCDITVIRDDVEVNGKSIMGLMMLALSSDVEFTITADGKREDEALEVLEQLIQNDFQK